LTVEKSSPKILGTAAISKKMHKTISLPNLVTLHPALETILYTTSGLWNLQIQGQRYGGLDRFFKVEETIIVFKTH
jgi:hypothetical protein